MSDDNTPAARDAARGKGRIKLATILGVITLLVTFVFNTVGVWQGSQAQEAGQAAAQIGLMTELNEKATASEDAINETDLDVCAKSGTRVFDADTNELFVALDYYEYLAWMFNEEILSVPGSRRFFAPRMIAGWRMAKQYRPTALEEYVELARFVRATKKPPPDPCGAD